MAKTKTRPVAAPPNLDDFGLEGPRKKSRLPEIALGLVIVAVCGLASLWFYSTAAERDDVLALRGPVARGEVLVVEDLIAVGIATDDVLATMSEAEFPSIVGQVAVNNMEAGTLVTPSMFSAFNAVADGAVVVGIDLEIGRVPAVTPVPGDTVAVLLIPRGNAQLDLRGGAAVEASELLVESATVVETAALGTQGRRYLALSMSEDEAKAVAAAAALDQVALIRVSGETN